MNAITINIIVKDEETFYRLNREAFKYIDSDENVRIHLCGITDQSFINENPAKQFLTSSGNCFKDFTSLLKITDTPYTVFFNEHVLIDHALIHGIKKELHKINGNVAMFNVSKFNEENTKINSKRSIFNRGKKEVDLTQMYTNMLYFCRYVFQTSFLKSIEFNEIENMFYEEKILMRMMQTNESAYLVSSINLFTTEPLETNFNSYEKQFQKEWYCPFFSESLLPFLSQVEPSIPLQNLLLHFIRIRLYCNLNGRDKFVIEGKEIDSFFSLIKRALQYISDEIIIESRKRKNLPKIFSFLLLKLKYGGNLSIDIGEYEDQTYVYINHLPFAPIKSIKMGITAINYDQKNLVIDANILASNMLDNINETFRIFMDDHEIKWKKTEVYNITKVFGKSINRFYSLQFTIPFDQLRKKTRICFEGSVNGKAIRLPLHFMKTSARLLSKNKASYYTFDKYVITSSYDHLIIKRKHKMEIFFRETIMIFQMFWMRKNFRTGASAFLLRLAYWLSRPRFNEKGKPNWLFFDKLYKAGDNAEYLFDYCYQYVKEANSYYIINKDAIDYPRLKEKYQDHVIPFNSLRHKLMVLNTNIIFATHASVLSFCGFGASLQRCFRNLLKAKVVCIQHGLTIQNIAQHQNRLQDNTSMYFCASKYEIKNLERPIYGYENNELFLTGSPRYDGLVNADQRQILIAPTWRRNIVITGNAVGTSKEYNPLFKNTKYFEIYNNLINDKRILEAAKKYNYKLVFLIHPTLSSQIEDYDKNDYLSIIPAISDISYEKMLTESSLMLTDYSGIQFDFAYMKKPILYYHPAELPPQYQEGVYQYETMAFGPIVTSYEDAISSLCEFMKNNCQMTDEYKKRVDDFFEYTDHNNCKRIMDVIKGMGEI